MPADESELVVCDDEVPGFFVRLRGGGRRTLGYHDKIGTKNRRLTLGTAVKDAFPDIRKRALALQAQVRLGTRDRGDAQHRRRDRQPVAVIDGLCDIER